jgi:hypothetical protein
VRTRATDRIFHKQIASTAEEISPATAGTVRGCDRLVKGVDVSDRIAVEGFSAYYDVSATGCWIWNRCFMSAGYGILNQGGTQQLAHRLSHEIHIGPIPRGFVVDHKCHQPACVNPGHLQAVTRKQNSENMILSSANSSGVRGVCWDKRTQSWAAGVKHNYVRYNLGRFKNIEDAERAVIAKRNELFTNNILDR